MTRVSLAVLVLFACGQPGTGGTGGGSATGGGMAAAGGGSGGGAGATVPDPGTGTALDNDWASVEPNNTPSQATPLGTAHGSIYVWVNGNHSGGAGNDTDYFVFKSSMGPDAGVLSFDMCFSPPITAMNASLWKVSGGVQQQPAVATWSSTANCVQNNAMPTPLIANTTYLFGVTLTADAGGTYSA